MEDFIFNKQQQDLLDALSKEYTVVLIFDNELVLKPRIYVCGDFRESDERTQYHSLGRYKDITDLIDFNSTYTQIKKSLEVIITSIEMMEPALKERKYNRQFNWIKF